MNKSRVEFEKFILRKYPWFFEGGSLYRTTNDVYIDTNVQDIWEAWEEGSDYGETKGNGGV